MGTQLQIANTGMASMEQWNVPEISNEAARRFWKKVHVLTGGGPQCWEWTGALTRDGYGIFCPDHDTTLRAHRVAWLISKGPFVANLQVCHKCDNRKCCRPDHLFLGDQQANEDDKRRKGRQARGDRHGSKLHPERWRRGESHPNAVLDSARVDCIRAAFLSGSVSISALSRVHGVSRTTIRNIGKGTAWREVGT